MQTISHRQAQNWLHSAPGLNAKQQTALRTHLEACTTCQTYAAFIGRLASDLPGAFPYPGMSPHEEARRQAELLEKAASRRTRQRLLSGARELSWVALATAMILVLSWIIKVNVPPAVPAVPAGLVEVTSTPANSPTPQGILGSASSPDDVRLRIMNPTWSTLTITGYARQTLTTGEQVDRYVQAWLGRDGRGRALISAPLPAGTGLDAGALVSQVWASDGQQLINFDMGTGASSPVERTWFYHPLEGADPVLATVLPAMFVERSSQPQILEETTLDGRPVLVVDWAANRLWLDPASGLVLRRQTTDENGQPFEAGLLKVEYDIPLPEWSAQVSGLENARFLPDENPPEAASPTPEEANATPEAPPTAEPSPSILPTETPQSSEPAQPGETPVPTSDLILLSVSAQSSDPAGNLQGSQNGELYFIQRSLGAPISRVLTRVALDCLQSSRSCPAEVVPAAQQMGDAPITWSPDGTQAVWIDHQDSRIMIYDRLGGEWRTVLDGASATMDIAAWSADSRSFVVTLQAGDSDASLATLVRADGSGSQALAPGLGGMQIPLGWPDARSFLVLSNRVVPKGSEAGPIDPVIARINLDDGSWTEVPARGDSAWLNSYPAISPDGQNLALQMPLDGGTALVIMSLDGQRIQSLGVNGVMPAWSPDGQWIAFIVTQNEASQVYVIHPDGSGLQQVFEWPAFPSILWLPGSQHLLVQAWPAPGARSDSGWSALYLASLAGGEPLRLTLAEQDDAVELVYPAARPPDRP